MTDHSAAQFDEYLSGSTLMVMSSGGIGEATLEALLAHPDVEPIEDVTIRNQQLGAKAVALIMGADKTAGLQSLHLSSNPLGDAGLVVLANSPRLASVQALQVQDVGATPVGLAALAASPHLRAEHLAIGWQPVGDAGAQALVQATGVKHLRLESAQVGTAGAVILIEQTHCESLSLMKNPVHLTGLSKVAPRLGTLNLSETPLTLADIVALASVPAPGLRHLVLDQVPLGDDALAAIQAAPWFDQLETLSLSGRQASPETRRAFIEAYGDGGILSIHDKDL